MFMSHVIEMTESFKLLNFLNVVQCNKGRAVNEDNCKMRKEETLSTPKTDHLEGNNDKKVQLTNIYYIYILEYV